MKKQNKTPRAKIKRELMDLTKAYVKKRDDYTCQKCLKPVSGSNCHCAHIIPVSAGTRLAFDSLNMLVFCHHDHIDWWHQNPVEAGEWFRQKFPERWAYLEEKKKINGPLKTWELEQLLLERKIGGGE